MGMNYTY